MGTAQMAGTNYRLQLLDFYIGERCRKQSEIGFPELCLVKTGPDGSKLRRVLLQEFHGSLRIGFKIARQIDGTRKEGVTRRIKGLLRGLSRCHGGKCITLSPCLSEPPLCIQGWRTKVMGVPLPFGEPSLFAPGIDAGWPESQGPVHESPVPAGRRPHSVGMANAGLIGPYAFW